MIPLSPQDLPVGQPLPWSLLDGQGNLMLGSGSIIPDARDLALMFRHGTVCRPDDMPEPGNEPDAQAGSRLSAGPLGLQVGTLLHVKTPGDQSRAAASRLIGFIEQGLFVTWPTLGGRELAVHAGEGLLLRGFSGHAIHSFTSTVTAVCRSPFRYLVLSAPAQTEQMPVRRAARVPTRLAAYLVDAGEGVAAGAEAGGDDAGHAAGDTLNDLTVEQRMGEGLARLGLLSDLSTGGALVQTSSPAPAVGQKVRLRFQLRTGALDAEVTIDATVRSAPGQDDEEFPAFGVAFDALGERELTLLQCFIYEQLLATTCMPV
ncbi:MULTISPECIES: flagellar brake protein [unclassified Cupriavidus]|jgi:Flagellar protein YcgR/PilZ domain|uniref:flagellar brake protein n=1 Tax=unclassified Cupriavidus TaxID=2640874 RepID=UPI001C0070BF|nr:MULTISPECIES: flagellar brake protein [unclassified Cupriavidus]MCA3187031.1 flagellar brake protein [Cupriavidus sp.]MCA3189528.1 flagellar brake protein [Cupriavidus sp.]MCA3195608.1 flagellar brake protein [Cupriavidus sp.]MCA3201163.1 flagellar brake protein [Cupriavidus sp.]MCA3207425.1 flagellar brake protein [Cupriavidus sp.]